MMYALLHAAYCCNVYNKMTPAHCTKPKVDASFKTSDHFVRGNTICVVISYSRNIYYFWNTMGTSMTYYNGRIFQKLTNTNILWALRRSIMLSNGIWNADRTDNYIVRAEIKAEKAQVLIRFISQTGLHLLNKPVHQYRPVKELVAILNCFVVQARPAAL